MNREPQEIPLSESLVVSELEAWKAHVMSLSRPDLGSPTQEQQQIYINLLKKAGEEKSALGEGPDIVAGAHLPSHSDVHHSCLTGQRIQVKRVMLRAIPVERLVGRVSDVHFQNAAGWSENSSEISAGWSDDPEVKA